MLWSTPFCGYFQLASIKLRRPRNWHTGQLEKRLARPSLLSLSFKHLMWNFNVLCYVPKAGFANSSQTLRMSSTIVALRKSILYKINCGCHTCKGTSGLLSSDWPALWKSQSLQQANTDLDQLRADLEGQLTESQEELCLAIEWMARYGVTWTTLWLNMSVFF